MAITRSFTDFFNRHSTRTPGTALAVIDTNRPSHTDRDQDDHAESMWFSKKDIPFAILLLAACIVTWVLLYKTGDATRPKNDSTGLAKMGYVQQAVSIIWVFNLVVMAWPAVCAFRFNQQRVQRLCVIGVSILVTSSVANIGLLQFVMRLLTDGFNAPIGYFLGAAALILHACAAYFLTRYNDMASVRKDEDLLARRAQVVKEAEKVEGRAKSKMDALTQLVAESLEKYEPEEKLAASYRRELTRATQAYEKSSPVTKLAKARNDLAILQSKLQDLKVKITRQNTEIRNEEDEARKARLRGEVDTLRKDEEKLLKRQEPLQKEIKRWEQEAKKTPERERLKLASTASKNASQAVQKLKDNHDSLEEKKRLAIEDHSTAAVVLKSAQTEEAEVKARIEKFHGANRLKWRDAIVVSPACLFLAFVCYAGWNAWVKYQVM